MMTKATTTTKLNGWWRCCRDGWWRCQNICKRCRIQSPPDSVNTEGKELIPPIWLPKYHPPNCHQYPADNSLSDGGRAPPLRAGAPWDDKEPWLVGNNKGGGWGGDVLVWLFTIQNNSGWPNKQCIWLGWYNKSLNHLLCGKIKVFIDIIVVK